MSSSNNRRPASSQKERFQLAWERKLRELEAYMIVHGHCNVPQRLVVRRGAPTDGKRGPVQQAEPQSDQEQVPPQGLQQQQPQNEQEQPQTEQSLRQEISLANWVHHQRCLHRKDKLDKSRKARLEALGFEWYPKPWLLSTKAAAGDNATATTALTDTAETAAGQQRNPEGETAEESALGEVDGDVAEVSAEDLSALNGPDSPWGVKFAELVDFKVQHGHCNVPRKAGPLANFVHKMRQLHKKRKLDPYRRQQLEGIGFEWQIRVIRGNAGGRQIEGAEGGGALGDGAARASEGGPAVTLPQRNPPPLPSVQYQAAWDARFLELEAFKRDNGHCRVLQHRRGPLAHWVDRQRKLHRKGELPPDRERRLAALGFEWTVRCDWWQRLDELQAYRDQYGHTNVPATSGKLGHWVMNQRKFHKTNQLAEDRKAALEELGFKWSLRSEASSLPAPLPPPPPPTHELPTATQPPAPPLAPAPLQSPTPTPSKASQWKERLQANWEKNLEALRAYKSEHGHTLVPTDHALHTWVHNQRKRQSARQLPANRKALLDDLGFAWTSAGGGARGRQGPGTSDHRPRPVPSVASAASWERVFGELRAFLNENGHLRVPPGGRLSQWLDRQRRALKDNRLDSNRQSRLDGLGIEWSPKDAAWEEMFEQLRRYRDENGDANVPKSHGPLGIWVQSQRRACLKQLNPERVARLQALGLDVSGANAHSDKCWNLRFQELRKYHALRGHSNVPLSQEGLGRWVSRQRTLAKSDRLSVERKRQLDELGFDWDRGRRAIAEKRRISDRRTRASVTQRRSSEGRSHSSRSKTAVAASRAKAAAVPTELGRVLRSTTRKIASRARAAPAERGRTQFACTVM